MHYLIQPLDADETSEPYGPYTGLNLNPSPYPSGFPEAMSCPANLNTPANGPAGLVSDLELCSVFPCALHKSILAIFEQTDPWHACYLVPGHSRKPEITISSPDLTSPVESSYLSTHFGTDNLRRWAGTQSAERRLAITEATRNYELFGEIDPHRDNIFYILSSCYSLWFLPFWLFRLAGPGGISKEAQTIASKSTPR